MIVSEKHKYVFLQFPHTGCTAVGNELVQNYDGEELLEKHSMYHDFVRWAGPRASDFFVFSSIRNPMDETVSVYEKLRTNHLGEYSRPENYTPSGGHLSSRVLKKFDFINSREASFEEYFMEFHRVPYVSWGVLDHHRLDFVMRFERLQEGFSELVGRLELEQVRPLPVANKTYKEKGDFLSYYTPEIRQHAVWVFEPIMARFGYEFPPSWKPAPTLSSSIAFQVMKCVKSIYWKRIMRLNERPGLRSLIQRAVARIPQ